MKRNEPAEMLCYAYFQAAPAGIYTIGIIVGGAIKLVFVRGEFCIEAIAT